MSKLEAIAFLKTYFLREKKKVPWQVQEERSVFLSGLHLEANWTDKSLPSSITCQER